MENIYRDEKLKCAFCKKFKSQDTIMVQGIKKDVYICAQCIKIGINYMIDDFIAGASEVLENKIIKLEGE